jgi:hypothetical protein
MFDSNAYEAKRLIQEASIVIKEWEDAYISRGFTPDENDYHSLIDMLNEASRNI